MFGCEGAERGGGVVKRKVIWELRKRVTDSYDRLSLGKIEN